MIEERSLYHLIGLKKETNEIRLLVVLLYFDWLLQCSTNDIRTLKIPICHWLTGFPANHKNEPE